MPLPPTGPDYWITEAPAEQVVSSGYLVSHVVGIPTPIITADQRAPLGQIGVTNSVMTSGASGIFA